MSRRVLRACLATLLSVLGRLPFGTRLPSFPSSDALNRGSEVH